MTASSPAIDLSFLDELCLTGVQSGAYCGEWLECSGSELAVYSPATGEQIGSIQQANAADYEKTAQTAHEAFLKWRELPAPQRGEYVRLIGEEFRKYKEPLGKLVSWEMGKILQEGLGEVQEAIDIADFAVGQSRMLYGLSMHSERSQHAMREQWHPLGVVGVISAFNFPAAVWAWNSMLAMICGDSTLWKPSSKTPLTAIAMTKVAARVLEPAGWGAVCSLVVGRGSEVGEILLNDKRVPLVSATGSCSMGKHVAETLASRYGRTILELGGNNAVVVMEDADLEMAARAIMFGAVGTAGQRCTSTRRVLVHKDVREQLVERLQEMYAAVSIGNPLEDGTLMGPMIDQGACDDVLNAIEEVKKQGGEILCGGEQIKPEGCEGGFYLTPAIATADNSWQIVQDETFGPLLYIMEVDDLDHAIQIHNDVPQGLSSSIFTLNMRKAERFLSAAGSDCGIANVNIGTSGAEIGGAFGGEKETGGGRESGSDSWKAYMRRQTNTVNWGDELPLAQGISFDVE
ncbi:MAG: aldehyde dehydrogenase family protein [Planctomycetota bacterium]|jgi:aldehyde dehydrogenase (NAD+)|nr:aldehyde dehydrogenase family protein [Planctomycetota bacterium]MDP6941058.1 aldehyde dehydrogenase family protein [Planctomycetota bacterium]